MYPNPADFIVPFQLLQSSIINEFNVLNALNPISIYPIYNFCWTNYITNSKVFETIIKGGSGDMIELSENVINDLLAIIPNESLHLSQSITNCRNILQGYKVIVYTNTDVVESWIIEYLPIYNMIKTLEPLPFEIGNVLQIINQSVIDNASQSEIIINGVFNNTLFINFQLYLYNISINEIRKCQYDNVNNKLLCNPGFTQKVNYTDKYLIYNNFYPFIIGNLIKFMNGQYFIENSLLSFQLIQKGKGYILHEEVYCVHSLENINEHHDSCYFQIKRIGIDSNIEELEMTTMGCENFKRSHYYYIIPKNFRHLDYATIYITNTATAFRCKVKGNRALKKDFIGNYFTCFLLSPIYTVINNVLYTSPNNTYPVHVNNTPIDLYQAQQITGVSGICNVLFLSSNPEETEIIIFVNKISPALLYRFILYESLSTSMKQNSSFADALHFCIQNYQKEGIVPLNFSGTYLTQSQMSCYEITVLNLILPNRQLDALNSLLTTGFPYVLLEISNVTQPNSGNKNVIYSNNPAVVSSTFVCSISDVNNPIITKFIKISSDGTIQTIKFTPADNLRFRILLPSGEIFTLQEKDYLPPSLSDPRLQIEALIELKRL
jgi:hypothetical protein